MGFNLFFAGVSAQCAIDNTVKQKCCVLLSQTNERKIIQKYAAMPKEQKPTLFIDSGAFSVAHSGKTVDIDDYINYINEMDAVGDYWAELDVIPFPVLNQQTAKECAEKSWKNYLYMLPKVVKPDKILPLYHFGEPTTHLEQMLNEPVVNGHPAPYIGIGGRHGVGTADQMKYFDRIFNIIAKSDNPKVKVHAFGVTILPLLEKFPFYSSDSTRWLKLAAYGQIMTDLGYFFVSKESNGREEGLYQMTPEAKKKVIANIESYGYTFEQLQNSGDARMLFNMDWFKHWADNYVYKPYKAVKKSLI